MARGFLEALLVFQLLIIGLMEAFLEGLQSARILAKTLYGH
jgi:hypothetical protein